MTTLAKSVGEMTPDEAATVVDRIDRKIFGVPQNVYDDLLLRATGFSWSDKDQETVVNCSCCGKEFGALRRSALYCSSACQVKASRRRNRSV